ncbi:hypothetical protein ACFLSY_04395 [Bacteroidota bacterium]
MENFFNNRNLLGIVLKWKYHLIVIAFVAAALSAVFSSSKFIDPMFKSTAVAYPVNLGEMSDETDTEQMLEILQSNYIRERIYDAFELDKHYEIEKAYVHYRNAMDGEFSSNVSFRKTENDAVKITLYDKDPQMASDIIDSLLVFYSEKVTALHREKDLESINIYTEELKLKAKELESINNKLSKLAIDYGIVDISVQTEEASRAYYRLLSKGTGVSVELSKIEKDLKNLKEHGAEFRTLTSEHGNERKVYDLLKLELENRKREFNKKISFALVVTNPFPADKKSTPVRSVIVVMTVLLTILCSLMVIGLIENKKTLLPPDKNE